MGRKKSQKTLIKESYEKKKKRQYTKAKEQSWKQLGISDEHGWDNEERQLYFRLVSNLDKALGKGNMTKIENRKDDRTKKDIKGAHNYAFGIWSTSTMPKTRQLGVNFIKHVVKNHFREKREKGYAKDLTALKHIRKNHVISYIEDKRSGKWNKNLVEDEEKRKPCRESSISRYMSTLEKIFECTTAYGIKSHKTLMEESKVKETKGKISVYDRVRGVGKTDGKKGYTLEQCRRMIEVTEDPIEKAMIQTLAYVGLRYESLSKVTWDDFVNDREKEVKQYVEFEDGKKFKGGRVLATETKDEVRESLQTLYDTGLFKEDEPVFGYMSRYRMQKIVEQACDRANVDYKGFHEFRFATKEYNEERVKEMTKDQLVREIIGKVNSIYHYNENGEKEYPLNPVEKQFDYVRDKNGERIPLRTLKNGVVRYKKKYIKDKNGQVKMDHRYTYDKYISRRRDYLEHIYISLSLSHNRSDVTSVYEDKDPKPEETTEEQVTEPQEEAIERTMEFLEEKEQEELPRDQWEQMSLDLDEE
ncbi:hypothetical protein PDK93_25450 [Bacillus cereus]|nr:hypothetical protein [Bacillus cereus]